MGKFLYEEAVAEDILPSTRDWRSPLRLSAAAEVGCEQSAGAVWV